MYLQQHSIGSILRSTIEIYKKNFGVMVVAYFIPVFLSALASQAAILTKQDLPIIFTTMLINFTILILSFGVITAIVSDLCVGNRPSILRAYRHVFGSQILSYIYTYFLVFLLTIVLLVITLGGVFFLTLVIERDFPHLQIYVLGITYIAVAISLFWTIFSLPTVVLERLSGIAAIKRSIALVKGQFWRVAIIQVMVFSVTIVISVIIGAGIGMLLSFVSPQQIDTWYVQSFLHAIGQGLGGPFGIIGLVLTYYDLRARKEGYNTTVLAQELRR